MKSTEILYPFGDDEDVSHGKRYRSMWKRINEDLNDMKEGESISFEELFNKLGVTEEDYILAIRSSLKRSTIFLKRNPNELRINNYNKHYLVA